VTRFEIIVLMVPNLAYVRIIQYNSQCAEHEVNATEMK